MNGILYPVEIIKKLPIWDGMKIADLGCGSGIFTIELAKALNGHGYIWAADIQEKSLAFLNERALYNKVNNVIETKLIDLENKNFSAGLQSVFDMVCMVNVLFQIKEKSKFITEAKRLLKQNGFLVIIDWEVFKIPQSDNLYPVKQNELLKDLESMGFTLKESLRPSNTHFGLILIKN